MKIVKRSREARQYSLNGQTTSSSADLFGDQPFTHLCDTLPTSQNMFQVSEPGSIPTSDLGFSRELMVWIPNGHVLQIIQR
ncbi:MAG: hypothetical protein WAU17_02070 [Nitrospirales bacterium]